MNRETRSMVMTLAVCYHARIQQREEFEITICAKFQKFAPLMNSIDQAKFQRQISRFMCILYLKTHRDAHAIALNNYCSMYITQFKLHTLLKPLLLT